MKQLEQPITTGIFRTGSAPHVKIAAISALKRWWAAFIPVSVIAAYGIAADSRWLIAALAVILLVVPALLLVGYINAMADGDAVSAQYPRQARFDTDGTITVWHMPLSAKPESGETLTAPAALKIAANEVNNVELNGHYVEVIFGGGKHHMLIPIDALEEQCGLSILLEAFGRPAVNS